jgi:hypothetical protein
MHSINFYALYKHIFVDKMITLGKRPREGFSSSTPGALGSTPGHSQGPRNVPFGSNIPVQNVSSQIHTQTNTTASVPLLIKPWRNKTHIDYFPGDIIFTQKNQFGRLQTVSDLVQMNAEFAIDDGSGKYKEFADIDYNFFGIYRNETNVQGGTRGKAQQMLINVDVFGRSKIANIFGTVKKGDHVGLVLYSGGHFHFRPTVNSKVPAKLAAEFHDEKEPIMHIPIGIVSFTSRPVSERKIVRALMDRDGMTKLPQIEILIL